MTGILVRGNATEGVVIGGVVTGGVVVALCFSSGIGCDDDDLGDKSLLKSRPLSVRQGTVHCSIKANLCSNSANLCSS